MAKIIYGPLISEFRGSIAGVTFQRNASGFIAKLKSFPTVNPSNSQGVKQVFLSALVNAWGSLSLSQKLSWSDFSINPHVSVWGSSTALTGYQWFMSCNLNIRQCGSLSTLLTAPSYLPPAPPPAFSIKFDHKAIYLEFESAVDVGSNQFFVYATPPIRSSSLKIRKNNFSLPPGTWLSSTLYVITVPYCTFFNIEYSDFILSAVCQIVCRCKFIDPISGLCSTYSSNQAKVFPTITPIKTGYIYKLSTLEDTRNICPEGWHVLTYAEFQIIVTSLSGTNIAGGHLKENFLTWWNSPNTGADNSSGLTLRGTGYLSDGVFYDQKNSVQIFLSGRDYLNYYQYFNLFYNDSRVEIQNTINNGDGVNAIFCKDDNINHGFVIGNNFIVYATVSIAGYVLTVGYVAESVFRNGDAIPFIPGGIGWRSNSSPCFCYFDNDISNV